MGPFWKVADDSWLKPTIQLYSLKINSTASTLRFVPIIPENLGIYVCVARVGRTRYRIAANVTEKQVNQGDIFVTLSPEASTLRPQKRKKRSANIRIGLEQKASFMSNSRKVKRSLQGKRESQPENAPLENGPARDDHGLRPVKTPCEEDKLFSKTGIIIVAALTCATFLLLYMVILLMAVPRICFPYYPKTKTKADDQAADTNRSKDGSSTGVAIPLSHKGRHNGRSDSGIESVDGLEEKSLHHGGGKTGSPWEIGSDKLEEFYRRTANENTGSDEDMLSGLKVYNMERNIPRRGRSESVPVTPYRYQSSIYVKV